MCLVCSFSEMAAKNVLYFSTQTKQIFNLLSGTFLRPPQRRILPISSSLRNLIHLDKEVTFSCSLSASAAATASVALIAYDHDRDFSEVFSFLECSMIHTYFCEKYLHEFSPQPK